MLNSRIVRRGSGFAIDVNGDIVPTYAYVSYQPQNAKYEDFKRAGVRLFSTGVYTGDRGINQGSGLRPFRPGFYKGPDEFDFQYVDEDFRRIVGDSQPGEAYILPRLMLEMPSWWENEHMDECCLSAQGAPVHMSFSSEAWLRECEKVMRRFQEWLSRSGWDKYVIGWHIAAGNTEEFIRPCVTPMQFADYSEVSRRAFAAWLKEKYGSVEALNRAWRARLLSFDDVRVPTPARREFALGGDLRDDAVERAVVDFYRFYNREVSLFAQKLVASAKQITDHRQIMGIFYGNMTLCATEIAHNDMSLLLRDKNVDFLASPFAYTRNRAQGIHWGFQSALDAARLNGKPFFVESDIRTDLSRPISECMPYANPVVNNAYDAPVWLGPDSIEGSLGQMTRALADVMSHAAATWWFDMWGGWYDRPEYMAFHKRASELYQRFVNSDDTRPVSSVCVFVDEDAFNYLSPSRSHTANSILPAQLTQIGAAGSGYHTYMLDDIENVDPDEYRMAMLIFPAKLTPAQSRALEKWKAKGRSVLFTLLPGWYGAGVTATTGFDAQIGAGTMPVRCLWNGRSFPEAPCELPDVRILPRATDIVLANLEDGRPGLVMRREEDHQVLWSVAPCLPAELLRYVIALSGGHIYCYDGSIVAATNRFISVHAASDGVKRICLPGKGRLKDVFTGEIPLGNETYTEIRMSFGETRLFEVVV